MLRKLLFASVIACSTASLPVLFQSDPGRVADVIRYAFGSQPDAEPPPRLAVVTTEKPRSTALSGRKVVIESDRRGHFVADFRLNGRRVEALVDTGATLVAMNQTTARSIGLSFRQKDFTQIVDTANGRTRAATATLDSIEVGRVQVRGVRVLVLEDAALSQTLVGMSFLNKLSRFSVEGGTLVLVE